MLREFFLCGSRKRRALAWGGLAVFALHALFKAWLKWALNTWYTRCTRQHECTAHIAHAHVCMSVRSFYDALQDVGANSTAGPEHYAAKRAEVTGLLLQFCLTVSPALVVHPAGKWVSSFWRFTWRVALVRAYLAHYDVLQVPVEGAAQRIHEDTQRFEAGIYSCFATILDSLLTLCVFVPVLYDVGAHAMPAGVDQPGWLVGIAVGAAVGGLLVSMIVGHRLVELEVDNQKVEGKLRTKLVVLEQTPTLIVGTNRTPTTVLDAEAFHSVTPTEPRPRAMAPTFAFRGVIKELKYNYMRLFANFAAFNTWVGFYDQVMVLVPFLVTTPLLFATDPARRITLGTLMRVSNSFDKVFGAMAVVSENWSAVNDFRSTVRRLREFEAHIYARKQFNHTLLKDEHEAADIELSAVDAAVETASATSVIKNGDCTHTENGRLTPHVLDDDEDDMAI